MKKLMRIVMVLVLVLIVGVVALYFYRNSLIRSAVESQASSSLGVKTTLGSANLAPFGGTLALGDLRIASPTGYQAPEMFTLGELGLGVNYSDLRKEPVRVSRITIDKPKAVLEFANGKFNFQALMDQMAGKTDKPADPNGKPADPNSKPADPSAKPTRMIIDELTLKDASVVVRAPMLPTEITVNIPTVTLKQIGNADGAQNGAAIREVVGATMSALAASAANSPQLKGLGNIDQLLRDQASQVMNQVSKELGKQVESITGNVTSEINKAVGGAVGGDVIKNVTGGKDPGKAIDEGLKGLIPGGDKKDDKKK